VPLAASAGFVAGTTSTIVTLVGSILIRRQRAVRYGLMVIMLANGLITGSQWAIEPWVMLTTFVPSKSNGEKRSRPLIDNSTKGKEALTQFWKNNVSFKESFQSVLYVPVFSPSLHL
jgi:hypothetical protein